MRMLMTTSTLTRKEKRLLLYLAYAAIRHHSCEGIVDAADERVSERLKEEQGVFVSLYRDGKLDGCMGNFNADAVYKLVPECAVEAAYHDPRFPATSLDRKLKIEISLLTKPQPLDYDGPDDLLSKLTGTEGVILSRDDTIGTFLPQVWKHFPVNNEFLSNLCLKAELDPDAWKHGAEIQIYSAEIFSGHYRRSR
jgi:AmmeMemoRadiSam system protein A